MDTQLGSGEPEPRQGIGGRVRRFIDSELNRALDKKDHQTDEGDTAHRDASSRAPEFDRPPEPDRPYVDPPGRPTHPATTAPVEPTDASPTHDTSVDKAAAEPVHGRSSAEAVADGSAERVGLLNDPAGLRDQWQRVQGTFVDDPQRAVHEASVLVDRTLEEIRQNVTRGQTGDPTSTEDLRVSFQRYREFFQRLLSA